MIAGILGVLAFLSGVSIANAQDVAQIGVATTGLNGPDRNAAGSNRVVILSAAMEAGANHTITSATYGGRAMTSIATAVAGTSTYARVYLFYLTESEIVQATSNTFTVTWSGAVTEALYAGAMFGNVDQDHPIRDFATNASDTSSPNPITTSSINIGAGEITLGAVHSGNSGSYAWNNSFIEGSDQNGSTSTLSGAGYFSSSNSTIVASATHSGPNRQVIVAATLKRAPRIYYVRTDGSNANSGTGTAASSAWQTIDYAADNTNVRQGDRIYVRTGTYNETINPARDGSSYNDIEVIADVDGTIFGGAGGAVIVQAPANQHALHLNDADYFEFRGFTFSGDSGNDTLALANSAGVVIRQCEIYGGVHGVEIGSASSAQLVNCLIHNNSGDSVYLISGSAA